MVKIFFNSHYGPYEDILGLWKKNFFFSFFVWLTDVGVYSLWYDCTADKGNIIFLTHDSGTFGHQKYIPSKFNWDLIEIFKILKKVCIGQIVKVFRKFKFFEIYSLNFFYDLFYICFILLIICPTNLFLLVWTQWAN